MFLGKWVVRWVNFTQFWGGGFWYEFFWTLGVQLSEITVTQNSCTIWNIYVKAVCTNYSIRLINVVVTSSSSINSNSNSLDATEPASF
jgi:hypothetical protein